MPIHARVGRFVERYRLAISRSVLVVVLALVAVGWEIDEVRKVVVTSGVLLVVLLGFVIEMSGTLSAYIAGKHPVQICRDDAQNNASLESHLAERPPKTAHLLEYSANSVLGVVEELARRGAAIRILIRHPKTVGKFQRRRILASIAHIERFVIREYRPKLDLEMRCYRMPASLRGRKFDNALVNLGWYTSDISTDASDPGMEVMGHTNPLIMCSPKTEGGDYLAQFFERYFTSLWAACEKDEALTIWRSMDPRGHVEPS